MEDEEKRAVSTVWKFWDLKKKRLVLFSASFLTFTVGGATHNNREPEEGKIVR